MDFRYINVAGEVTNEPGWPGEVYRTHNMTSMRARSNKWFVSPILTHYPQLMDGLAL